MVDIQSGRRRRRLDRLDRLARACCASARARRAATRAPPRYGKGGTEPTVTDADLVLGYVPADFFLGGEIPLDASRRRGGGRDGRRAARPGRRRGRAGDLRTTVNSFMADQITEVATRRGHDVRDFTLVAGGGAGPVHAASSPTCCTSPRVVIPPIAATYSAFGMFAMDVGRNYARSYITRAKRARRRRGQRAVRRDGARGRRRLRRARRGRRTIVTSRARRTCATSASSTRSRSTVPAGDARRRRASTPRSTNFHARHEELYTFNMPLAGRRVPDASGCARRRPRRRSSCRAIEPGDGDPARRIEAPPDRAGSTARRVERRSTTARCCGPATGSPGPAIVEETTTTVVVPPGYALRGRRAPATTC